MALASFSPHYKAPTEIIRMRDDLAALPAWYALHNGLVGVCSFDYIENFCLQCVPEGVVPYGRCVVNTQIREWMLKDKLVGRTTKTVGLDADSTQEPPATIYTFAPWGWDPSLCQALKREGIGEEFLPDELRLQQIRCLSGRQQCVKVLNDFEKIPQTCGKAQVCTTMNEVTDFLSSVPDVILKAPWSGSGRGLARTSVGTWTANLQGWVSRILRTQGAVMAEPIYNKVCDFAMEFECSIHHNLSFVGYSLFETDSHGNYKENLLASNANIIEQLTRFVPLELLEQVKKQLLHSLTNLLSTNYVGFFGVDMMICEEEKKFVVHPCVEINLRMNMGVVARLFYDRYVDDESEGSYVVEHYSADGEAVEHDTQLRRLHPVRVVANKLVEGYFPLTPVMPNTRYQCYVILHRR